MLRKVLLAAALIIGIAAVPAEAQYSPAFVVSPGRVQVGDTVTFNGEGCQPGDAVYIRFNRGPNPPSDPQGGQLVATVTADAEGNFGGTFVVPSTMPGIHTVVAVCGPEAQVLADVSEGRVIQASDPLIQAANIIVIGPPSPPGNGGVSGEGDDQEFGGPGGPGGGTEGTGASRGGGRSGPLPATGSDFNMLGLVGLGLLAVGGLVLLTTRTRSTRTA